MSLPSDACSLRWDAARGPAWGTASFARFWVALEQPGPWGRTVFDGSRLDPAVGLALEAACADAGGRALLMRPVAARGGGARSREPHRVHVAGGMPSGRPWLLTGLVDDPVTVLELPWGAVADGDIATVRRVAGWLEEQAEPVALVCAHSRRDVCCAVRGRPVARDAVAQRPGRVWECSHTGGHRFAPTGVLLPTGLTLGRVEGDTLVAALDAAADGRVADDLDVARQMRGLAHLTPPAQAADAAVRAREGISGLFDLTTTAQRPGAWRVTHVDGRSWTADVGLRSEGDPRPGSCGAAALETTSYDVRLAPA